MRGVTGYGVNICGNKKQSDQFLIIELIHHRIDLRERKGDAKPTLLSAQIRPPP